MPLISVPELTRFAEDVLMGAGVPADKAEVTAACLVAANLRGVDSHGMQLLPFYIEQLLAGEMDPRTDGRVISESGCCLLFDGAERHRASGWPRPAARTPCGSRGSTGWRWWWRANRTTSARPPGGRRRCAPPGRSAS